MTDDRQSTRADEFAHIRSPRARHPVLAGAAALLAFYLVLHLRADLRYALSTSEPLDLGDARVTFAPRVTVSDLDNRYVRVRGAPDRESGLEVDTKGSWTFSQFFRVLGTGDRLFVHRRESPLPGFKAEADVFEGRLVRFSELPFEDAVRAYFSAHVAPSHFFAPADLKGGIVRGGTIGLHDLLDGATARAGTVTLRDLAGDLVSLAPDDLLFVDVARPGEVRVGLPTGRWPKPEDARAAIERLGGAVVEDKGLVKATPAGAAAAASGALAFSTPPAPVERWTYIVRFPPEDRDARLDRLAEEDRQVELRDARETIKVRLGDVGATTDGLSMRPGGGAERRVTLAEIAAVRTVATAQVPPDAHLLIEADRPRDHLSTLLLALAVATFGVFNLAAVVKELRR